jgi:hypothetical protein
MGPVSPADVWCFDVSAQFERQGIMSGNTLKCVGWRFSKKDFIPKTKLLSQRRKKSNDAGRGRWGYPPLTPTR